MTLVYLHSSRHYLHEKISRNMLGIVRKWVYDSQDDDPLHTNFLKNVTNFSQFIKVEDKLIAKNNIDMVFVVYNSTSYLSIQFTIITL